MVNSPEISVLHTATGQAGADGIPMQLEALDIPREAGIPTPGNTVTEVDVFKLMPTVFWRWPPA